MRLVLFVAMSVALSACGVLDRAYREPDARTVRADQVVSASYAASLMGRLSSVMLPSGRLDLVVTTPAEQVSGTDAIDGVPLRAAGGQQLVGVGWTLQRAAYPDSPNRQLAPPDAILGQPRAATLTLIAGERRITISGTGDLTPPAARPRNAVWIAVPADPGSLQVAVGYDGVTQTVDARTGKVSAGLAAPLYGPLPLAHRGVCGFTNPDVPDSCLMTYASGYPYVTGAGWAPAGTVYVVLFVSLGVDHLPTKLAVAETLPVAVIPSTTGTFSVFRVRPAARYPVGGTAVVGHGAGTSITSLNATLVATDPS